MTETTSRKTESQIEELTAEGEKDYSDRPRCGNCANLFWSNPKRKWECYEERTIRWRKRLGLRYCSSHKPQAGYPVKYPKREEPKTSPNPINYPTS